MAMENAGGFKNSNDLSQQEILFSWNFPEYTKRDRSRLWYLVVGGLCLLILIYSIITVNVLFVAILVLAIFTVVFQYLQPAREIPVLISDFGVTVDKTFYAYRDLSGFSLIYSPPRVKYLYLEMKGKLRHNLPIHLAEVDPNQVREVLQNFLKEDLERKNEDFNETVAHYLHLR